MWFGKILLLQNKMLSGPVKRVDLILRIVSQISGQDNVSYKIRKSYWHFQVNKFCAYRFCSFNRSKKLLSKYLY